MSTSATPSQGGSASQSPRPRPRPMRSGVDNAAGTSTAASRQYDSPLRRERAAQTRDKIISAGSALVHEMSSWDWRTLTIRAVAERAGVHERTVYRHFAAEQDLRAAVSHRLEEEAGLTVDGMRLDDLAAHISQLFRYLGSFSSSREPSVDASLEAMDQRRKLAILDAITAESPDWADEDRLLAAALIDVLWGVAAYRRLVGAWGLEPADATRGVNWLIRLMVQAIREGDVP